LAERRSVLTIEKHCVAAYATRRKPCDAMAYRAAACNCEGAWYNVPLTLLGRAGEVIE